jgi:hypothetical protein
MTSNFFSPLSFIAVFGSGIRDPGFWMGKNQDLGYGIRDKHPGSATLMSKHRLPNIFLYLCQNNLGQTKFSSLTTILEPISLEREIGG